MNGFLRAGSFILNGFKALQSVAIVGAAGMATWGALGGPNSLPQKLLSNLFGLQQTAGAEAGVMGSAQAIFKGLEILAEVLKSWGVPADFLGNWARERMNSIPSGETAFADPLEGVKEFASDNSTLLMVGGATALGLPAAAKVLTGGNAPGGASFRVPGAGPAQLELFDDAAKASGGLRGLFSKIPGISKIPVIGKYLAIGGTLAGVTMAGLGALTGEAKAAENPGSTITTDQASLQGMGADLGAMGVSMLGARSAAQIAIVPAAASLGVKAIPGLASVWAAGEGLWDTTRYALNGEWEKAGTRFVAGVGETVAGVGGILTYGTLGTAWREATRAGGAMLFGEDKAIEHSHVYELGSGLVSMFTGATNNANRNTDQPDIEASRGTQPAYVPALY